MIIKLLSTDFDGTLVNHDQVPAVTPALFDLLTRLRSEGALWAINTGRGVGHIVEGLLEYGFPFLPDFIITCERDIFRRNEEGTDWEEYGDWNARCSQAHDTLFKEAQPLLDEIHNFIKNNTKALPINDISGIGLVAYDEQEMEEIAAFIDSLKERHPAFHYQRNTRYMRFCHADYSKGTALGELSRLLKIPRTQIFAAGDHYNDISMLDGTYAACVACPSNAAVAVKQTVADASGYVANQSFSEGIVEALDYYINK